MKDPLLFTASYDETIRLWDVIEQKQTESISIKETQANALAISPDGHQLAVGCYQTLRLFDCNHLALGNTPLQSFNVHERNVTTLGFSHDSSWIFTGSEDQTAKVWDLRANTLVCQRILQLNSTVNSIVLHPNHVELIVADSAGGIFVWDIRSNRDNSLITDLSNVEYVQNLDISQSGKNVVGITNKGNCLVYSSPPESMLGADSPSYNPEAELSADPFGNIACAPSPVHVQNDNRNRPILLKAHEQYGLKCKFLPDGNSFVTTAGDEPPKLWELTQDENNAIRLKQTFYGESVPKLFPGRRSLDTREPVDMKWIWDVAITNDGSKLFTAGSDYMLRMFDIGTGKVIKSYKGHLKAITAMAFWEPKS